jgi:hypothetical protein
LVNNTAGINVLDANTIVCTDILTDNLTANVVDAQLYYELASEKFISSPEPGSICMGVDTVPATIPTSYVFNTVIGQHAGRSLQAPNNVVIGYNALGLCTGGTQHVAIGYNACANNVTGNTVTAVGHKALEFFTGSACVAVGQGALGSLVTGVDNVAMGFAAGFGLVNASSNTAIGHRTLRFATGDANTVVGASAGLALVGGTQNVLLGAVCNVDAAGGSNEIVIGYAVTATASNQIRIGNSSHTTCFLQGVSGVNVTGVDAQIGSNGQLGVVVSSQRYKEDIQPVQTEVSDKIMDLHPVSFFYKTDVSHESKVYGLIAEQVYEVLPELVLLKEIADENGNVNMLPDQVLYKYITPLMLDKMIRMNAKLNQLIEKIENSSA